MTLRSLQIFLLRFEVSHPVIRGLEKTPRALFLLLSFSLFPNQKKYRSFSSQNNCCSGEKIFLKTFSQNYRFTATMRVKLRLNSKAKPLTKNTSHSQPCSLAGAKRQKALCFHRTLIILERLQNSSGFELQKVPTWLGVRTPGCLWNVILTFSRRSNWQSSNHLKEKHVSTWDTFISSHCCRW